MFLIFRTRNTTPTTIPAIRRSPSITPITAPAMAPALLPLTPHKEYLKGVIFSKDNFKMLFFYLVTSTTV